MSNEEEDIVEATVGKVVIREKGSYIVAYPTCQDSSSRVVITCSLENWEDTIEPRKGQVILLMNVREFSRGWRANNARPKRMNK